MNILILGDIYARPGRELFFEEIESLRKEHNINLVIVNGENIAHGRGISKRIYTELMKSNVSCVTMGNHTWGNQNINDIFELDNCKVIRPLNIKNANGKGYLELNYNGKKILIVNLIGKTFVEMPKNAPYKEFLCPFKEIDKLINEKEYDYLLVDFHAELTSEKIAMGHYLDGKANIIYGTHTHVQTSDSIILPKGSAYITDVGMTGALDSVIGVKKDIIIDRFINGYTDKNQVEDKGRLQLNAVVLNINKTNKIKRISYIRENTTL